MGHGIAQVAAAPGFQVVLFDVNQDAVAKGLQSIKRNLAKGIERGKITEAERDGVLARITTTTDLGKLSGVDLIIEAAPEKLTLKQDLLQQCEAITTSECIFATNTSSLSITEIARLASRPDRVVGMHFFNPVHLMKLVEIVVGELTSEETTAVVREIARRMKKEP